MYSKLGYIELVPALTANLIKIERTIFRENVLVMSRRTSLARSGSWRFWENSRFCFGEIETKQKNCI